MLLAYKYIIYVFYNCLLVLNNLLISLSAVYSTACSAHLRQYDNEIAGEWPGKVGMDDNHVQSCSVRAHRCIHSVLHCSFWSSSR